MLYIHIHIISVGVFILLLTTLPESLTSIEFQHSKMQKTPTTNTYYNE